MLTSKEFFNNIIKLLADKAGYRGMINGQMLDMKYTNSNDVTIEQLKETDYYKQVLYLP